MALTDPDGWQNHQMLVLQELKRIGDLTEHNREQLQAIFVEIALLKRSQENSDDNNEAIEKRIRALEQFKASVEGQTGYRKWIFPMAISTFLTFVGWGIAIGLNLL